jgi:hypothetical protein
MPVSFVAVGREHSVPSCCQGWASGQGAGAPQVQHRYKYVQLGKYICEYSVKNDAEIIRNYQVCCYRSKGRSCVSAKNRGKSHNTTYNKSCGNMSLYTTYLGMAVRKRILITYSIKRRLISGNI